MTASTVPADIEALIGQVQYEEDGEFPVEQGYIYTSCSSVENGNPLFWDENVANEITGGPIAPPTMISVWFRPHNWSPGRTEPAVPLQVHFDLKAKFDAARPKLYAAREKRIHPGRDEKILTDWNGLALRAFADAAAYLGRDDYRQIAESNAEFILGTLWDGNRLLHNFKDGRARFNAYLDDYANVADGLLSLYQLTFEEKWLNRAESLTDHIIDKFLDSESGGFYFTEIGHEALITRTKDYFDNATPSGNSVAADVLVRLGALLERNDFTETAKRLFASTGTHLAQYPSGFGRMLEAIDFYLGPSKEIAIVVSGVTGKEGHSFITAYRKRFLPRTVIAAGETGAVALLRDRPAVNGKSTAYICENMTCQRPVTDVGEFENQLA